MNGLKTLLDDVAGEAKLYDVFDRAEAAVRRRRRLVRLAPLACATVVAVVLGTGWAILRDGRSGEPAAGPGTSDVVSWLPASIRVPAGPVGALPADRAVGPAALLYARGNRDGKLMSDPGWQLVLPDGTQYWMPPGHTPAGLSPDGRWLAYSRDGRTVLRDLTGTGERTVAQEAMTDAHWSPDGTRLVLIRAENPTRDEDDSSVVVDLATGGGSTVDLGHFPGALVVGLNTAGELVLRSQNRKPDSVAPNDATRPGTSIQLWFVDPSTGQERRHTTVDFADMLPEPRDWLPTQDPDPYAMDVKIALSGSTLLVRTYRVLTAGGATSMMPDDLLAAHLDNGQPITRYALPDPTTVDTVRTPSPDNIVGSQGGEWRAMLVGRSDEVLLVPLGPDANGFSGPTAIERYDTATRQSTVATEIHGDIRLIKLRGQP